MTNLRDKILSSPAHPVISHHVPEWSASFFLRPLSPEQWTEWSGGAVLGDLSSLAKLLVLAVHDEHSQRVFVDDDAAVLAENWPEVVARVADLVMHISRVKELNALARGVA